MKLGLLTVPFEELPLGEVCDWASSNGFAAVEVAVWPRGSGSSRRYAGTSHIDVTKLTPAEADDVRGMIAAKGLEISSLAYYPNPLDPDPEISQPAIDHLKDVIRAAQMLKVATVGTFVGRDKSASLDENFAQFEKVWPDIVRFAADHGVNITIENCPMIFSADEWPGGHNIAYAPHVWRRILEAWGGDVGMNSDPSHLVWQMIDQARFIREFGPAILHAHAKDLMIERDGLYEHGILSAGIGWQVPRMPGLGAVDWPGFFAGLYRAGYDGPVVIEHEDRNFEGRDDSVKRGFLLARDVLRPFVK